MGAEADCTATFRGKTVSGRARLESDVLQFRSADLKLSIPFKRMRNVAARGGRLSLTSSEGAVSFDLGTDAIRWAGKILRPPSRLEKLGVKPAWRAAVLGIEDADFVRELENHVAYVSIGRAVKNCDAVFFGATKAAQLARMERLKASLKPNGAIWVVRPKGRPEITEAAVMAAGKAAGLVDVKVVSFSPTHTAEKFVIPVAAR